MQLGGVAVADGDQVALAHEDQDLAELDLLDVLVVARRLEDHEEVLAVLLELGPLMGVDRVLDRERVQPELGPDRLELLLGRLVQPDPDPGRVVALAVLERLAQLEFPLPAFPVRVEGAVDDHPTGLCLSLRARASASSCVVASPVKAASRRRSTSSPSSGPESRFSSRARMSPRTAGRGFGF